MTMKWWHLFLLLCLASCAGTARGCADCNAQSFGGNWMVAQYAMDGTPIMCWKLMNTSVSNEERSDGIYWLDDRSGNLVHISGWYNRVQVDRGDWTHAASSLGVDEKLCPGGKYTPKRVSSKKPVEETAPEEEGPPAQNVFPQGSFPGE